MYDSSPTSRHDICRHPLSFSLDARLSDDPSVLSVVSSSMPSQPLPTDTPTSPVGVATSYSHQSLEQPSVGVSTPGLPRMGEQVETNDVLLGGPPGVSEWRGGE